VVNRGVEGDNGQVNKWIATAVAGALLLTGCGASAPETVRYYDPRGYFSANLPLENTLQVMDPQTGQAGPDLLSGVVSAPAPPSQAAGGGIAGQVLGNLGDTTVFQVVVLDAGGIGTLDELSLLHTSIPGVDVIVREPVKIGGRDGLLVVADHGGESGTPFGAASAFALAGGVAFWFIAAFDEGGWEGQRPKFLRILQSFRAGVPRGLGGIPLGPPPS
jgi:hypothetical protein